jgi:hypothetical protein
MPVIDPDLKNPDWSTAREREIVDLVNAAGSITGAERAAGVSEGLFCRAMRALKARAASKGYAPGHFTGGVADGYRMGKVTVHRINGEAVQTWERQHPELEDLLAKVREAVDTMKEEIPPARPVPPPSFVLADLCTQYTVTDFHFGELTHASETDGQGADWNLKVAEDTLVAAIEHLAAKSPNSETAVLALLGDLLHFDGPDPVTPTHRHPLDAAGRQRTMLRVVVRAVRRVVALLLAKHKTLMIVVVEGNHDISGTPWLQEILLTHYEEEPRVQISDNDLPFFAWQFGCNFLGFHHGHKRAKEKLPGLFAAMFRQIWGATTKGYIHCGHYHEVDEKEYPGVRVIQHPTISAPGSHALRGGWLSEREMTALHYHAKFGLRGRDTVTPEMLSLAA